MRDWSNHEDPKTLAERRTMARMSCEKLSFAFPAVVDTMKDETAIAYAAWPERLFVIETNGRVVYNGGQGPFGFWPTEKARKHVEFKPPRGIALPKESLEVFLERYLKSLKRRVIL